MDVPRPFERKHAIRIYAEDPGPCNDFHIGLVVDVDRETREANAALIAAAPEMGAMLLSMFVHVSHGGPTRGKAEALLKKAGLLP